MACFEDVPDKDRTEVTATTLLGCLGDAGLWQDVLHRFSLIRSLGKNPFVFTGEDWKGSEVGRLSLPQMIYLIFDLPTAYFLRYCPLDVETLRAKQGLRTHHTHPQTIGPVGKSCLVNKSQMAGSCHTSQGQIALQMWTRFLVLTWHSLLSPVPAYTRPASHFQST